MTVVIVPNTFEFQVQNYSTIVLKSQVWAYRQLLALTKDQKESEHLYKRLQICENEYDKRENKG